MPSPTDLATTQATQPASDPTTIDQRSELLLIVGIGARRFALPVAAIVRVLPMAAPTPLPDAPPGIAGALPFRGALLPVVDPRPRLGQPVVAPQPDQYLVAVAAEPRYLLWVDRAETVVDAEPLPLGNFEGEGGEPQATQFVVLDGAYLPLLPAGLFAPAQVNSPRPR
jgi:chemotaxis signal transduction protein